MKNFKYYLKRENKRKRKIFYQMMACLALKCQYQANKTPEIFKNSIINKTKKKKKNDSSKEGHLIMRIY
jgi:hypothetical protein